MHRRLDAGLCTVRSSLFFPTSAMTEAIVLAFDFGERRTGVAIANTLTRAARPLATIDAASNSSRWDAIEALVEEWQPSAFVIGVPRHPDGTPHAMTARCERFARQLEGRYARPVARVDERYSSAVSGASRNIDAEAAAVILQQWLEQGAADA
jgi:putative Holliday junction resolvase